MVSAAYAGRVSSHGSETSSKDADSNPSSQPHAPTPLAGGALLCSAYFAPIQWWQKVYRHQSVYIEGCDHFVKQTYRNRCLIATANGTQSLSVPVEKPADGRLDKTRMREVRISDHGDWRRIHWSALCAAYGESPFFEYYADDLHPFFERLGTTSSTSTPPSPTRFAR